MRLLFLFVSDGKRLRCSSDNQLNCEATQSALLVNRVAGCQVNSADKRAESFRGRE